MRSLTSMTQARIASLFKLSSPAVLAGALCFAGALSPSLVPRTGLLQGVLGGLSFTAGYFVVALTLILIRAMGVPFPEGARTRLVGWIVNSLALLVILLALSRVSQWQNEIRELMSLPPTETARPFIIAGTAFVLAFVLIWIGRLFRGAVLSIEERLASYIPRRVAFVIGIVGAIALFNLFGNDVLLTRALAAFDESYARLDRALPDGGGAPTDPLKTGSPASLIAWNSIGAEGRARVNDPLNAAAITEITGEPAREPLRIYVGLGSAETPQARAELALAEAIRTGAFERARLVITSPTGTGWIDAAGMLPLEVLTAGDVATVAVQYSYLPSWLTLLTAQAYGSETAQSVFEAFHRHWSTLPPESRPELWLWGLSLGAMNSDISADFYDLLSNPINGAFRAGPPFAGNIWARLTERRDEGSPAWKPVYGQGRVVRFMNQVEPGAEPPLAPDWGPVRILYLQYPSDGITFFSPSIFWRKPDWMREPRGADLSDSLQWLPLVTFFQVGFDLLTATTTPPGHGHVYAARDYLYGWQTLFETGPLPDATKTRLNALFAERGL